MKKIVLLIALLSMGCCNHLMGAWSRWSFCAQLQETYKNFNDAELETAMTNDLSDITQHFTGLWLEDCPNITAVPLTVQSLKLEYVIIINCRSLSSLEALLPLKQLKKIRIIGCPLISDEALGKLERELPNCTIICHDGEQINYNLRQGYV